MDGSIIDLEKAKFTSLINGIREGVVLLSPDQEVIAMNDKASILTGFAVRDSLGKKASDVLYMIDSTDKVIDANLICPIGGLDMEGVIFKATNVSLVDKKDVVKVVSIQSRKIKEGSKIGLGAIVVLDDVFEQGELERMKVDFVSMAVHMLRTPLTIIKGFLGSLLKLETVKKLSQSEIESLSSALAGADELDMLIENLLHLSEIQSGRFKIQTTKISYDGLVASVINEFKDMVQNKGLQLIYVPPIYELPQLKIDLMRIKEVLRNLLDNAVRFTEKGGIEVSISKDKDSVVTTIKDTGNGIPESNLEYIFTKFYRIKDPLEMEQGMGLGLFVSKQIIEAHRGKIWVESIEGQGSVFHFSLPIN